MTASERRLKKTGRAFFLLMAMLLSFGAMAQEVFVDASVNKNPVSPGEAFQITVSIRNSNGEVSFPSIPGIQFLYGPSTGQSVQIINGQRSSEYTYTYTFRANKEGVIEIPPIPVRTNQGAMKTQPFQLKVKKNNNPLVNQNFSTAMELSSRKVYLGEPIILRYKVYQRYGNFNIENYELPDFDGFWVENVDSHQGRWEQSVINGQRYSVATLKVDILFPQKTGKFTLEGFDMTGVVGNFFNRQEVTASSSPVEIEVLPLPNGKPEGFMGTYSDLSMKVEHTSTMIKANEAVNVSISFSGRGNLKLISEPEINWPSDLEVYDPEIDDRISITSSGVNGKRTFNYVIIPRTSGQFEIPGLNLSYFNAGQDRYKKLTAEPILLNVSEGEGGADVAYSFNSKSDVQVLNKEIRHIMPLSKGLVKPSNVFFGSFAFYFLYGAPFLLFGGLLFWKRRKDEQLRDVAGYKQKQAGKTFKKFLSSAEKSVGDAGSFYEQLGLGLESYLMDKLNIGRSDLNKRRVQEKLEEKCSKELVTSFLGLWNKCEMARFAPDPSNNPQVDLEQAKSLMEQMEKEL